LRTSQRSTDVRGKWLRDLILLVDVNVTANDIAAALSMDVYEVSVDGFRIWVISKGETRGDRMVEIEASCDDFYRYKEDEMTLIKRHLNSPAMCYLSYENLGAARNVCRVLLTKFDAMVDNDFGWLGSGKDFLQLLDEDGAFGPTN